MRAIMIAVDYTDLLRLTLPYNKYHFESVTVVTSRANHGEVAGAVAEQHYDNPYGGPRTPCHVLATDLFYERGASFNKWAALEWGLDQIGRFGWLCLMDADVVWPRRINWGPSDRDDWKVQGMLYTPMRRMCDPAPATIPQESEWGQYPLHRQQKEWAGYTQIFHAEDPVLGDPPWHQVDWRHCGGADSFFQEKWHRDRKIRPPFEVLHLGPAGLNWFGRSSARADGSRPPEAGARERQYLQLWQERRQRRAQGLDPFTPERLG